jgi:hypothetical protein
MPSISLSRRKPASWSASIYALNRGVLVTSPHTRNSADLRDAVARVAMLSICHSHRALALSPADSNEGGHLFQSDRGHHSNLMAASLVSSGGPVFVMSW